MVGVAVKVTELPAQLGFEPVVMASDTDGVTVGVIVIVIVLLVAVAGEGQVALLVMITFTVWPFVKVLVVNVFDVVF